ncbi:Early nodulin-like protein 1 [Sesamum alatum]|uniref:Early nodulin-like protein 1 n=1 Tax=Sesamum alatum TaxID=300844 RepID=A0AAE2CAX2_9LAMI|nr:Early nodulin-like protein 1 [Sesamum alatum]
MAALKTLVPCLAVLLFVSMISFSEAREFEVGGKKKTSWELPSSPDEFNKWAQINRFQIGDSILLTYDAKSDSVLEVSEKDYKTCNRSNPIKSYTDGNTKITLDKSGPFFFISGAEGHCQKGQKLEIWVLSAKHSSSSGHSPAPSPAENHHHHLAPAPAPSNGGSGLRAELMGALRCLECWLWFRKTYL